MFNDCYSLISLDLSNFNTKNETYMKYMFYDCNSLIYKHFNNLLNKNILIILKHNVGWGSYN